jgi:hypothetical protein
MVCHASPKKVLVQLLDLDDIFAKVSDEKLLTPANKLVFKSHKLTV